MIDLIIKNGTVVDGTGETRFLADIYVDKGKILEISNSRNDLIAKKIIDAKGKIVSPGFIDFHGHSDVNLFRDMGITNKLEQGVTTELCGLCGISMSPFSEEHFDIVTDSFNITAGNPEMKEKVRNWMKFDSMLSAYEDFKIGINLYFCVGHGMIRGAVMGYKSDEPSPQELEQMKELVRNAMESGAVGLSAGLIYPPGIFAKKNELIELCKEVKKYDGIYNVHLRSESNGLIAALSEAIDIGLESGVRVVISHHKVAAVKNWGNSKITLEMISQARAIGVDIWLDQYPYIASASTLKNIIPPYYQEMGLEKVLELLKSSIGRENILNAIENNDGSFENQSKDIGFSRIMVIISKVKGAVGKNISDYAKEIGKNEYDTAFDILLADGGTTMCAFFSMNDEDLERIMIYPHTMFGTDGAVTLQGESGHPRYNASFPRILGKYVREKKILTLENAVRKMTGLPATVGKFKSKGFIKTGYDADIVIFDENTIIDKADFDDATKSNEGIEYVIVNGEIALKDGKSLQIKNGRAKRWHK